MKITFLGTGTSVGVPQIGCDCPVCRSRDSKDKRMRSSALMQTPKGNILIDCGPDFRSQILRAESPHIDAALITHTHYDHAGGVDDLRPYCKEGPFPIYCRDDVARDIHTRLPYCFPEHHYPGAPSFDLHIITPGVPFVASGIEILPIAVMHGHLPIVGFRVGDFAYITDCSYMPPAAIESLRGVRTLVLNALRPQPHPTHFSLPQSIAAANVIGAERVFFTHMSHDMGLHADASLPDGMHLAYDGLTIEA